MTQLTKQESKKLELESAQLTEQENRRRAQRCFKPIHVMDMSKDAQQVQKWQPEIHKIKVKIAAFIDELNKAPTKTAASQKLLDDLMPKDFNPAEISQKQQQAIAKWQANQQVIQDQLKLIHRQTKTKLLTLPEELDALSRQYQLTQPVITLLKQNIQQALEHFCSDIERAGLNSSKVANAKTQLFTTLNTVFQQAMINKAICNHSNPLSAAWNNFKRWCNQKLHTHYQVQQTNRQIWLTNKHTFFSQQISEAIDADIRACLIIK